MNNRILVMSLVMLLALSLVAAGCPRPVDPVEPPVVRILRMATHSDDRVLTPFDYRTGFPGYRLMSLSYDTLFYLDADNIPKPWLAEEAELSADGLKWTFRLRRDVTWHDGVPFTAHDVKFTYEYFAEHVMGRFTGPIKRAVDWVEVVDRYTVVMHLKQVDPAFRFNLADIPILPKHIWHNVTDPDVFVNNIGTGPYKLVEYRPGELYRFVGNPNFFKGEPYFDEIIMPIIVDPTTLFTALRVGEIDAATRVLSPELIPEFEAIPGIRVFSGPGFASTILNLNNERYPFNIKEFRQALAHAIDLQYLVDVVLLGDGVVASQGIFHPASPWHNPDVARYEGGLEQARTMLDELGFVDIDGDGFRETPAGEKLELILMVQAPLPIRIRAAEIISSWFAEIGLRVPVRVMDAVAISDLVWPGFDVRRGRDYDMVMWGWSAPMQFDPWRPTMLAHSDYDRGWTNIVGFRDADVDVIIEQMYVTVDEKELKEVVFEFQKLWAEKVPFISLFFADQNFAYWPAAHDAWVFRTGEGIIDKLSLIALED